MTWIDFVPAPQRKLIARKLRSIADALDKQDEKTAAEMAAGVLRSTVEVLRGLGIDPKQAVEKAIEWAFAERKEK